MALAPFGGEGWVRGMVKAYTEDKRDALSANRNRAKAMRHEPVLTEKLFWSIARNRQLDGFKFKRQVLIGPYIADFVCAECKLIVELDGPLMTWSAIGNATIISRRRVIA